MSTTKHSAATVLALTLALALAGFIAAAAPAEAQAVREVKTATHGDWDVICAEGRDVCAIRQIAKNSAGNDVLAVSVRALDGARTEDGQTVPAIIDIIAPLGVALRAGVRVTIDGGEERAAPFEICQPNGCLVRSPVGAAFLDQLKRGNAATMTVVSPQEGEVTVTVSLRGFTRAYGEIE